ncbi:TraB/GumN family protein [Hyphococcus flavus]|uniref:TraB/GumN family protein n=1 Tax=Hyphococcus flavus TaxID=1866326 RepID=A0AAE9Z9S3_9PROT|nr:TraB/GumN family protein [Hyphococcus flavus]WDI30008.1 TraB/GumN family protein [Hyphococcus flavus]
MKSRHHFALLMVQVLDAKRNTVVMKATIMAKYTLLGLAASFLAIISPVMAQAPAATLDISTDTATPAMWRVADADSEYILLGTFHILPATLDWRTDALNAALEQAETVYFEVEADAPDTESVALNVVMTKGFYQAGETLSGLLGDADTQELQEITTELGLPFSAVNSMRPWNAFLTLSVQFIINQGFDPGSGVDSVLLKEARENGKEMRFFETLEEQLSFFTGLDPEVEKNLLRVTIREWDDQQAAFDELFAAWTNGDVDFVDEQMNDAMREQAPEVYERLIVERNKVWAEELDAALKNEAGTGLVAVGAGHLVGGEFSVPALLAAKGYEVTPYGEWTESQ